MEHTLQMQRREMLMDEQWLEQEERQLVRRRRSDPQFTPDASAVHASLKRDKKPQKNSSN